MWREGGGGGGGGELVAIAAQIGGDGKCCGMTAAEENALRESIGDKDHQSGASCSCWLQALRAEKLYQFHGRDLDWLFQSVFSVQNPHSCSSRLGPCAAARFTVVL